MAPALDSAPKSLSLDAETTLDLVPSKALVVKGPVKKPRIKSVNIRSRRVLKALPRNLGVKKHTRDQQERSDHSLDEIKLVFDCKPIVLDSSRENSCAPSEIKRQITNHTKSQYWVQSADKQPIDTGHSLSLETECRSRLRWTNPVIAPVYRLHGCSETDGLVCVLPHALLIKPATVYQKKPGKMDRFLSTRFGLVYQPIMSRYLAGFRYYLIDTTKRRQFTSYNAYQILESLREPESQTYVEVAELEIIPHCIPTAESAAPKDPYYGAQWNLSWINAEKGWAKAGWSIDNDSFEPGKDVIVAVIDSGIDLKHPDFVAALVPGATFYLGPDDDPETGEKRVYSKENPATGGSAPPGDGGHGTMCAGIIGARGNNNKGITGLAGACKIMPINIEGYSKSSVARAITYAAGKANVISMSFGGDLRTGDYLYGTVVKDAIDNAFNKGVVLCASTMNQNEAQLYYPASHPNVLACGASGYRSNLRSQGEWDRSLVGTGSNYGTGLDVLAPGARIRTTIPTFRNPEDPYGTFNGTSSAAPQVAALAALLISAYPDRLKKNPDEVYRIIRESAISGPAVNVPDQEVGYGRIDVLNAFVKARQDYGEPT